MKEVIDGIYPVTPTQEALLLRSISSSGVDPGFTQLLIEVVGNVDAVLLERAWQLIVSSHSALRTSFHWEEADAPVQVIRRDIKSLFAVVDLSEQSESVPARLQEYLDQDRERGFDLTKCPLARLAWIKTNGIQSWFVISIHHLVADGWSSSILVRDLITSYADLRNGRIPSVNTTSFVDYWRWLQSADLESARSFWSEHLRGVITPLWETRTLAGPGGDIVAGPIRDMRQSLAGKNTRDLATAYHVTEGTVLLAAWSLVLMESFGRREVVVGVAVSGRSATLSNGENMVGLLSTTVPVRVKISDSSLADWLREIQRDFQSASEFSYLPMQDIQDVSEGNAQARLFDTVLVVQNQPTPAVSDAGFHVLASSGDIVSVLPLTITWNPHTESAQCFYDSRHFHANAATGFLTDLARQLRNFDARDQESVDKLVGSSNRKGLKLPDGASQESTSSGQGSTRVLTASEQKLLNLWLRVLGREDVSIHDDFFAIGGTSLQAVHLTRVIEKEFGRKVSTVSIALFPTVRRFVTHVLSSGVVDSDTIVKLSHCPDNQPALFGIYTPGGDAIVFNDVARALDGRRTVYALQPVGADGEADPIVDMEKMAERAVNDILQVQPNGPFHLASICGGGLPYEVARQLLLGGHELGVVVVVDPGWVNLPGEREQTRSNILDRAFNLINAVRQGEFVLKIQKFAKTKLAREKSKRWIAREMNRMEPQHRRLVQAYYRATYYYNAVESAVSMQFLLTKEWREKPDLPDRLARWRELALGGITVRDFGECHDTVLSGESAAHLADTVEELIAEHDAASRYSAKQVTASSLPFQGVD